MSSTYRYPYPPAASQEAEIINTLAARAKSSGDEHGIHILALIESASDAMEKALFTALFLAHQTKTSWLIIPGLVAVLAPYISEMVRQLEVAVLCKETGVEWGIKCSEHTGDTDSADSTRGI